MNWRRILAAIALGGWLIFVGGIIYLGSPHTGSKHDNFSASSKFTSSKATIVLSVKEHQRSEEDHSLHCGGPDAQTIAKALGSDFITRRTIAALSPQEITLVVGANFIESGRSPFKGLRITYDFESSQTTITSRHRDPTAARLLAERLYVELLKYFRTSDTEGTERALKFLREKQVELLERTEQAENTPSTVRSARDIKSMHEAEENLRINKELLRNIENRIAETVTWAATPPPIPVYVIEATMVRGPLWNRTATDFTADVSKLEKP